MATANNPFVILATPRRHHFVGALPRCLHCTKITNSVYLLNGEKAVCEDCVKSHNIPELTDRQYQVLQLFLQGHRNCDIAKALSLSVALTDHAIAQLRRLKIINRKGIPRTRWIDPRDKKEYFVNQRDVGILELAISPELRFDYRFRQTIVERTGIPEHTVSACLKQLRERGIYIPSRKDRFESWLATVKEEVLLRDKPPKAIAKLGNRRRDTPVQTLNRQGIRTRKKSATQRVYQVLVERQCSYEQILQELRKEDISDRSVSYAIYILKREGVIAERDQVYSLIQEVEIERIKTRGIKFAEKTQQMPQTTQTR